MNHIRRLIDRAAKARMDFNDPGKRPKMEEREVKNRVLNIIEYLKYFPDEPMTQEEREAAIWLIEEEGLLPLLDISDTVEFQDQVAKWDGDNAFCIRCGRKLSNDDSVFQGMGLICRNKAEEDDWEEPEDEDDQTRIRREAVEQNFSLPLGHPDRIGIRRIASMYSVSSSTIRYDRLMVKEKQKLQKYVEELIECGAAMIAEYKATPIVPLKQRED